MKIYLFFNLGTINDFKINYSIWFSSTAIDFSTFFFSAALDVYYSFLIPFAVVTGEQSLIELNKKTYFSVSQYLSKTMRFKLRAEFLMFVLMCVNLAISKLTVMILEDKVTSDEFKSQLSLMGIG